jgi:DNA-binding HxlR family transcriptional regulator
MKDCPIATMTALIGDHCTVLIVRDLLTGPKRFKDLEESLEISTRTLTIKLQNLEQEGMIIKKRFDEVPPRVEYSLTKKGKDLEVITKAMKKYAERYYL